MGFEVHTTAIAGVLILERSPFKDERGSLERLFARDELLDVGVDVEAIHVNLTRTAAPGIVKGLHLQKAPFSETKVIACLSGAIFDVAVDLRPGSPTHGEWFGIDLSGGDTTSVVIPPGCAHGMQALRADTVVHYVHSARYRPSAEVGVHPLDRTLSIAWPLAPTFISARDNSLPAFEADHR